MKKACFCGKVTLEFPEKPLLHFMCHCVDCDLLWNGAYMGFVFPTDRSEERRVGKECER